MAANQVVAGADGSEESLRAVEWAAREAALRGAALRLLSVPELPPRMSPDPARRETVSGIVLQTTEHALATARERAAAAAPGVAVDADVLWGPPAQALTEASEGAAMVVVGSRGAGGFSALILGSLSRYVALHAPCPVAVVREETATAHREIVVGIGELEHAGPALGFAFEEAALRQARLLAVHAWSWYLPVPYPRGTPAIAEHAAFDPGEQSAAIAAELESLLAGWRDKYPTVRASAEVVRAHAGRVLAGMSARAGLVVLGRRLHGRAPAAGVTHAVLSHAHGPVVLVPGG
jgi:nucleotide-binding universal stress UspA family protein